jgi:hypothetical protein
MISPVARVTEAIYENPADVSKRLDEYAAHGMSAKVVLLVSG